MNTVIDVKTNCKICKIEQPIEQNKMKEQPISDHEHKKRSRMNKKHERESEQSVRIDNAKGLKGDNAVQSVFRCNNEKRSECNIEAEKYK